MPQQVVAFDKECQHSQRDGSEKEKGNQPGSPFRGGQGEELVTEATGQEQYQIRLEIPGRGNQAAVTFEDRVDEEKLGDDIFQFELHPGGTIQTELHEVEKQDDAHRQPEDRYETKHPLGTTQQYTTGLLIPAWQTAGDDEAGYDKEVDRRATKEKGDPVADVIVKPIAGGKMSILDLGGEMGDYHTNCSQPAKGIDGCVMFISRLAHAVLTVAGVKAAKHQAYIIIVRRIIVNSSPLLFRRMEHAVVWVFQTSQSRKNHTYRSDHNGV